MSRNDWFVLIAPHSTNDSDGADRYDPPSAWPPMQRTSWHPALLRGAHKCEAKWYRWRN